MGRYCSYLLPNQAWGNYPHSYLRNLANDGTPNSVVCFDEDNLTKSSQRRVGIAKVMERSLHSGRFVFVENLARSGQMKKVEYDILDRWYDFLTEQVPGFDLRTDLTGNYS